jgi:predicted HicB family RNase H-like nuclease
MKNNLMRYKNYHGSVNYSDDDGVLYGKLEGIRDLVSYEGRDVESLRKAFKDAVDDYLDTCRETDREPERPFKGSFNIRVSPEIHRMVAFKAMEKGITLNKYVSEILEKASGHRRPGKVHDGT